MNDEKKEQIKKMAKENFIKNDNQWHKAVDKFNQVNELISDLEETHTNGDIIKCRKKHRKTLKLIVFTGPAANKNE